MARTVVIDERGGQRRRPRGSSIDHSRIRIADLVDVTKKLVNEIACFLKIVELDLLAKRALLRHVYLHEESGADDAKNQHHHHHLD
jgi:hypothetical protein